MDRIRNFFAQPESFLPDDDDPVDVDEDTLGKLRERLLWELRWSRDGYAVKQRLEQGKEPPSWFYDEPHTSDAEWFYIRSYFKLATCKGVGMSMGPIPWTAIHEFVDRIGFDQEMRGVFERVIWSLDNEWQDWSDRESKKKRKRPMSDGGVPSGKVRRPKNPRAH